MALIRNGEAVDDPWLRVADDQDLPDGPVIVTHARWRDRATALAGHNGPLGIVLTSDQPPALIAEDLDRFDVVALDFPAFTDGRAYSHARLLRERYGFTGELRAVGNVLRDQLAFMARCGFDAFEIADDDAAEAFKQALAEISVAYQPATDARRPAMVLRHG
jgi:uncharacterized protein (DUF934 family)